ncbi:hypothetical protein [Lacrimispora celerecrescens]|nr:hypothetical protein [Lacrimispora celerecrescens]
MISCLEEGGKIATDPITLTPDQDGVLQYPGLKNSKLKRRFSAFRARL